jgi:hypothetical protein
MILENKRSGRGVFSMGNISPVNNMVGISMPSREISIAVCWESVLFEIKSPSESAVKMSKLLSAKKIDSYQGKSMFLILPIWFVKTILKGEDKLPQKIKVKF